MKITFILFFAFIAAAMAAQEHFCEKLGNPESECGKFGMKVISKDDFDCRTTTKDSDLCMVKAGLCYTLYPDAKKGTKVAAFDGKQISHVTYCAHGTPAEVPEPAATSAAPEPEATSAAPEPEATSAAPEPEATSAAPEPKATSAAPEPKATSAAPEPKATSAAPEPETTPEPKPEPACVLKPRSWSECKRLSYKKENCDKCVTSKCKGCRAVFEKACVAPKAQTSVASCVSHHCKNIWDTRKKDHCKKGMAKLCAEQVCGPKPEPETTPEPKPEGACVLKPRSWSECKRLSYKKENCDKCVTSKCKGCRAVFEKACVAPKPQTSVASCVAHHCKNVRKGSKRDHCYKGMAKLCAEQVCGPKPEPETTPEPKPETTPEPKPEPACILAPRSKSECKRLSYKKENCDKCVTSKCKGCRAVFEKACVAPKPQTSVASCVVYHCKNVRKGRKRDHCYKGMAKLCAEQVCGAVKKTTPPKRETPPPTPKKTTPPAPKPCNNDIATDDLPNVIYIAAEAEDCTSALQKEVNDLEVMVEKITMLLKVKGVPVGTGETCVLPPGRGGAGTPPPGGKGGKPNPPPGGKGGKPNPPPGGKGGKPNPPPGGKPNPPPGGGGMGSKTPTTVASSESATTPPMSSENSSPPERVASTGSSSAAVNTMLVVGLVVGAAVAAGVAAVAIGIAVSAGAAGAGAASSAAPMSAAATNPLYTPLTSGGTNPGF